jgi:xylulokinase
VSVPVSSKLVEAVLGVDIGTSSSKGVLVALDGTILASATREHSVSRPAVGHVEMDPRVWWDEFLGMAREVTQMSTATVVAVGVSGMGPCVGVADDDGEPLRPAILYGVDTRAVEQIKRLSEELDQETVVERCGSALSTQSVGPKLAWIAEHEPDIAARSRRLFMPSSWLVFQLTGEYVLDHHSASQCTPMYDTAAKEWHQPWFARVTATIEPPRLLWPGEVAGWVSPSAAEQAGLPAGIPVIAGTIDAWTEAVSVGAHGAGDLMLMYGTTMFLVNTSMTRQTSDSLWGTVGAFPGTYNLAGGMATSGAITQWLRNVVGSPDYATLIAEAAGSGPGAKGLLMLPYFAGERTPFSDPDARGTVVGLTLDHKRGDLYRAALEATAFGVRHNIQAFTKEGGTIERVVAVGGGTQGGLWTQIVSDVTGLEQVIPTITIGASFGAAFLAASCIAPVSIKEWNPPKTVIRPDPETSGLYTELFTLYRDLYPATRSVTHRLATLNRHH